MAESPGIRQTVKYYLGLYMDYPVAMMKYNCCSTDYNYVEQNYTYTCYDKQMDVWPQCILYPYILGIILFLYWPIVLFQISAFFSQTIVTVKPDINVLSQEVEATEDNDDFPLITESNTEWVFVDGKVPLGFVDLFRDLFPNSHPVTRSRVRRFLGILLIPFVIYIKLLIYSCIQFKTTNALMDRGVPSGFLSLIANTTDGRTNSFVPLLGGPITIALIFYLFSVVIIVFPQNLKQIVQDGLSTNTTEFSALCFSSRHIQELSQISVKSVPGYKNAANHLHCCFYMMFSKLFWKETFDLQTSRFHRLYRRQTGICQWAVLGLVPFYILLCILELIVCILFFAVPLVGLVAIMVRATIAFVSGKMSRGGQRSQTLLNNKVFLIFLAMTVSISMIFYAYSVCLVFIESFFFLSEFLVYSYIAVILYPTAAFGYLFFVIILIYYIFRLIRGFGHRYLDLLNDIVEIALNMNLHDNYVTNHSGHITIFNAKIAQVKSVTINGKVLPIARNAIQCSYEDLKDKPIRIKYRDNVYGIPKDLFEYVVRKILPVHRQVLRIGFQLGLICVFLLFTNSLLKGPKQGLHLQSRRLCMSCSLSQ